MVRSFMKVRKQAMFNSHKCYVVDTKPAMIQNTPQYQRLLNRVMASSMHHAKLEEVYKNLANGARLRKNGCICRNSVCRCVKICLVYIGSMFQLMTLKKAFCLIPGLRFPQSQRNALKNAAVKAIRVSCRLKALPAVLRNYPQQL